MTSLVGCSSHMLFQSSLCWWDLLYIGLICEKLSSGPINVCALAGPVTQQNDKSLMVCMTSSCISLGAQDNMRSASVSSGNTFQVVHVVFLPCLTKLDTVSQPVSASNIGSTCAFLGPSLGCQISEMLASSKG